MKYGVQLLGNAKRILDTETMQRVVQQYGDRFPGAAASAQMFVDDGFLFRSRPGDYTILSFHIDRAYFGAEISSASLWIAPIFAYNCYSWH